MKIKELKQFFVASISELYPSEEVQSFFNLLSEKYLGMSRIELVLQSDENVSEENKLKFKNAIQRLKNSEPIQYIIGETEFFGLPFKVDKNVLIPRPETEELVAWVLNEIKEKGEKRIEDREERRDNRKERIEKRTEDFRVLDIGTGSGCIPIALASKLPKAKITGVDISKGALEVAKQNAQLNKVTIKFLEVDILNNKNWNLDFKNLEFDLIISNPPYVRELEKEMLKPNVLNHEPATALFVKDEDPLLFYRKIAKFSRQYLKENGTLFFEINEYLSSDVCEMLRVEGFKNIEVKKDIFGKDRMVKCNKK